MQVKNFSQSQTLLKFFLWYVTQNVMSTNVATRIYEATAAPYLKFWLQLLLNTNLCLNIEKRVPSYRLWRAVSAFPHLTFLKLSKKLFNLHFATMLHTTNNRWIVKWFHVQLLTNQLVVYVLFLLDTAPNHCSKITTNPKSIYPIDNLFTVTRR